MLLCFRCSVKSWLFNDNNSSQEEKNDTNQFQIKNYNVVQVFKLEWPIACSASILHGRVPSAIAQAIILPNHKGWSKYNDSKSLQHHPRKDGLSMIRKWRKSLNKSDNFHFGIIVCCLLFIAIKTLYSI